MTYNEKHMKTSHLKVPKSHALFAGRFRITGYRPGSDIVIAQSPWMPNLIVDAGLQEVLEDLMGQRLSGVPITKFKLGTGSTAPAASDTNLETPIVETDFIANRTRTGLTVLFELFLPDAEVPENDYTECGLFIGDTMFSHALISPTYSKAANQDTKIDYEVSLSAI